MSAHSATPHRNGWRVMRVMPRTAAAPAASRPSRPTLVGLGVLRPMTTSSTASSSTANISGRRRGSTPQVSIVGARA